MSLEDTLDDLVVLARHMRADPKINITKESLSKLRDCQALIIYYTTPKAGFTSPVVPKIEHVKCSIEGCTKTSADQDACMLRVGNEWRCREHLPKRDVPLTGFTLAEPEKQDTENRRKIALDKLSKEERPLINRNIVI